MTITIGYTKLYVNPDHLARFLKLADKMGIHIFEIEKGER